MTIIPNKTQFDNPIFECCRRFFKRFKLVEILRRCGAFKKAGIQVGIVFLFLLGLVFECKKLNVLRTHYAEKMPFGKDVIYRCLSRSDVNWERIVFLTANNVIHEIKKLTSDERRNALVFDDTTQYRNRSKKVEMLAKCYDHCEHRYYSGHTLLTMGWIDGQTFVPVDYRVVSASDDKNLLYISDFVEDNRTIATRRRKDARRSKPELMLDMLGNVQGSNADCQYVLFDSWFSSPKSIVQINNMGYDVVAMLKNNKTRYYHNGENLTLKDIFKRCKKRPGRSKHLLSVEIELIHKEHGSISAKIVYVRNKNKRNEWIALICTDMALNEEEIIALYGKRWDIEVFFKVCKSVLKLGKEYQCRSFDSTCATVAIAFIRYMKLAVESREERDERSLGALFESYCKELDDISFAVAFELLIECFIDFMRDVLRLSKETVSVAVDDFIASLPRVYAGLAA
jgi:hypothetical protein